MSAPKKSNDITDRMGVYQRIDAVPDEYRLGRVCQNYGGRDVWAEFCQQHEYHQGDAKNHERRVDRHGRSWKDHMAERPRHHAAAEPKDAESWCARLVKEYSLRTAFDYWQRIDRFYEWMTWHWNYPHRYNPVRMAVVEGNASQAIWDWYVGHKEQARKRQQKKRESDE